MKSDKPLLIYDGDCGFCRKWIARWEETTGDSVVYKPASEVASDFPLIPAADFERAVQLIRRDGSRCSGARAVLEITAPHSIAARVALRAHRRLPLFQAAMDAAYGLVAANRVAFSRLTKILWGSTATRPTYAIANGLFLRLLALVFLIALVSFQIQAPGLIGSGGVLPVAPVFESVHQRFGPESFRLMPSLVWLAPGDAVVSALSVIGMVAAGAALLGILQPLCFLILWAVTLSLTVAGQDFYNFQWDALLIEAGFLAIFLAPWKLSPGWLRADPPRLARFATIALLFRLMFCAGVVKLVSGDPEWRNLTALNHHFLTQPLPTPAAWFVQHWPPEILQAACAGMFVIELLVPFAFFLPRIPRTAAALATIALQAGIALTGNYAFFNLLTVALCLLLIDDKTWPRFLRARHGSSGRRPVFTTRWLRIPVCSFLLVLSLVPLSMSFRVVPEFLKPLANIHSLVAPFRTVNSYGLFAVMTTERREILIQGSRDGLTWETYRFRWAPGALNRPPPLVAPYQPRLDWQMWFAALGRFETTPWFQSLLGCLLRGDKDVLALFDHNPFPQAPPRFVRALSDTYLFTDPADRARTGNWWKAEPAAIYCPEVSLRAPGS